MTDRVLVRGGPVGTLIVGPENGPVPGEGDATPDVAVLEVRGGHLAWSVLAAQPIPAAVLEDVDLAQEWIWAVYGEQVALAVDDFAGIAAESVVAPGLPALWDSARKLGYAHWASRWWPASTLDGIPALDQRLVDLDIATLTVECERLVDGADAVAPDEPAPAVTSDRATDYALAAGPGAAEPDALVLARGTGGWDWRRCPPGLVDASERAVSWEVRRQSGNTAFEIFVISAPTTNSTVSHPDSTIPTHLRPRALIRTTTATTVADLTLTGDTWTGTTSAPPGWESTVAVDIYVPGIGHPDPAAPDAPRIREQIRTLATTRLRTAADTPDDTMLLAEIAAAASDTDF
ncbi:hypothetical protein [Nocardia macrotermitis]|uniref:Uncharacterized protein n=1 Tax=Nocardia macrotermitis TaxID=2585198 RepID=A0A7K0D427_9NOCA|nr:hypothetical protein [Nocardia macrotermitis]MQY20495.1 hypothetical protein [Nocardia macrotermitis]